MPDVDAAVVRNQDLLALGGFLGVTPSALETALSHKTKASQEGTLHSLP